jgi:hypothetical protein
MRNLLKSHKVVRTANVALAFAFMAGFIRPAVAEDTQKRIEKQWKSRQADRLLRAGATASGQKNLLRPMRGCHSGVQERRSRRRRELWAWIHILPQW